jgi:hypothetical protein
MKQALTAVYTIITITVFCGLILPSCSGESRNKSTNASNQHLLDYNIALDFINGYTKHVNEQSPTNYDTNYIERNALLTDNFKRQYDSILDDAKEEGSLDCDPIFDAQDFPDKGFSILKVDTTNGFVTVVGRNWPEFELVLKVVKDSNKTLVDGVGVINIPENRRRKK